MKKFYYKIVYITTSGAMTSAMNPSLPLSEWVVTYKLRKWAYPKIPHSKLFAFSSLKEAKWYMRALSSLPLPYFSIYKCELKDPERIYTIPQLFSLNHEIEQIKLFWEFWHFWQKNELPKVALWNLKGSGMKGVFVGSAAKLIEKIA